MKPLLAFPAIPFPHFFTDWCHPDQVRVRSKAILSYGGIGDDEDESDDEAPLPAATRHSSGIPAAIWRLLQGIYSSNKSVARKVREIAVQEPLALWQKVQVDVIL